MHTLNLTSSLNLLDYQRSCPQYLIDVFPRSVAGWYSFSPKDRIEFVEWERERLISEGYHEQPNGSWLSKISDT